MRKFKFWPDQGLSKEEIQKRLREALAKNIFYGRDFVMGFPGTKPLPIGVEAYTMFMREHPNNICTHTSEESEKGFGGSQELERRAIYMMGELMGATADKIHGYISSGGTESNIMGVILAREYFRRLNNKPICIITSFFTHYSIRKAAWLLGISTEVWERCEYCSESFKRPIHHIFRPVENFGKINLVGTDEAGRVLPRQIEASVRKNYYAGERNFLIVLSQGNVITGALDDTSAVNELLGYLQEELPDANFYIHVDAAFGGFVVPFLYPERPMPFQMNFVKSVTMDPHKMGLAPYPGGAFLYRKDNDNLRDLLGVQMGYVPGGTDGTLIGSRPGAAAAACYAIFNSLGLEGYSKIVNTCMKNANTLKVLLAELEQVKVIENDLNVVSFAIKKQGFELSHKFIEQTVLVHHLYPVNFSNPYDHVQQIYKVTCMPHVTEVHIVNFVKMLKKELPSS